ncbi:neuraminidase-like domain-containing protein [Nonomuraea sp. B19D2]|uniref:neuraminidase-like domain-containing protein n=1 Tax=Nonomuraea sp. B19D2 TaxID=3159561 RepID=UPI0032DB98D9
MRLRGRELHLDTYGDDVAALQFELARLGFAIDASERRPAFFGESTLRAVREFQHEAGLEPTGVVDEETARLLTRAAGDGTPPGTRDSRYRVKGRVLTDEQETVPGSRVAVVHVSLAGELLLAEGGTGDDGAYEVAFDPAVLPRPGDPDLLVRASAGTGELGVSEVRYNAGPDETIDVVVRADLLQRPDEYRRVTTELAAHLNASGRARLGTLGERDGRRDVTYLANKTGWDARVVAMAVLADRFGADGPIAPELYYALFRAGVPADPDVLAVIEPSVLRTAWERAVEEKVIAAEFADLIPSAVRGFREAAARRLLERSPVVGPSSMNALLVLAGLDEAERQRFALLHAENQADLGRFWERVTDEFGQETAERLRLDGQLAQLTLNNGELVARLRRRLAPVATADLARARLYEPAAWDDLLDGMPVPDDIPGADAEQRRAEYAALLAAQLRVSHPTAVVAAMVDRGEMPVPAEVKEPLRRFLTEQQGRFELGVHPVDAFAEQHGVAIDAATRRELRKMQRVYQITPSDTAMAALLRHGIDSAYTCTQYSEREFVARFGADLGGDDQARLIYAKASQVQHAVLALATGYLTGRAAPPLHVLAAPLRERGGASADAVTGRVDAAQLEELFGELDYCACEHCRSVLSPAAYLVDLLEFLDLSRSDENGPRPPVAFSGENPLDVLLERRPDLAHLQLTCANTNIALPAIDLVNEILEHLVVHGLSLADYTGHDVPDTATSAELLASPQFVDHAAYSTLKAARFPLALPFHPQLETMRRYLDRFALPLAEAMEKMRNSDGLDPPPPPDPLDEDLRFVIEYAWRDILRERLGITPQEHRILTSPDLDPRDAYGFSPDAIGVPAFVAEVSKAKNLTRRLGITYAELIELLNTRTVNPHVHLLPLLQRLGVDFATIKKFHDGQLTAAQFAALLPAGLDPTPYGGDVVQWVTVNHDRIMNLMVLSDPTGQAGVCDVGKLELRHALPDHAANRVSAGELLLLLRFVRLWRRLGWTIGQADAAVTALWPADQLPSPADSPAEAARKQHEGFSAVLLALGHLVQAMRDLDLRPDNLDRLLAGFAADGADRSWLARRLGLSTAEFQTLERLSGLDPFSALAMAQPHFTRFIELAHRTRRVPIPQLAYFLAGEDPTGQAGPHLMETIALARTLRDGIRRIEAEYSVADDPTGDVARARTALVYGNEAADTLFGLLCGATTVETDYRQAQAELPAAIQAIAPALGYDHPAGRLTYRGMMTDRVRGALLAAAGLTPELAHAVTALHTAGQTAFGPFFERHPDLRGLYIAFADSGEPLPVRMAALLAVLLANIRQALKRQLVHQAVATEINSTPAEAAALLDDRALLHVSGDPSRPAVDAYLGLEQAGLTAAYFSFPTLSGAPDRTDDAVVVDYGPGGATLPDSVLFPGAPISGVWSGHVEAPATGDYIFSITADTGAQVKLDLAGVEAQLVEQGGIWRSRPIELAAGVPQPIRLVVRKVRHRLSLRWESTGVARAVVPASALYPTVPLTRFARTHLRLLKACALAEAIGLSQTELVHFSGGAGRHQIAGQGWLNALPAEDGAPAEATVRSLFGVVGDLIRYADLREELGARGDDLVDVLRDPAAAAKDGRLTRVTGWPDADLKVLLGHLLRPPSALAGIGVLVRVKEMFDVVRAIGGGAATALAVVTHDPDEARVDALRRVVRVRYAGDENAWHEAIRPVNDELRGRRRDALVAFVLHAFAGRPATAHIDTPDKLFEHLLIDVAMDPCMQTSRVKQAISTVQTFVQRCQLNLEDRVEASSIDARRWELIKRYRLWEAGRKVYLWPENWIEPELRDDKSPFFRDLESELLTADITDDAAVRAFGGYLEKLNDVAMLEISGMCVDENRQTTTADDIVHVVGHTTGGANRRHFYRRYAYGSWTPWEPITVSVSGRRILPVMWHGRLVLFWLSANKQAPTDRLAIQGASGSLADLQVGSINANVAATTRTNLHWSEYWNGRWQQPRTSDIARPLDVSSSGPLDSGRGHPLSSQIKNDVLRVYLRIVEERYRYFILHSLHGVPGHDKDETEFPLGPEPEPVSRYFDLWRGLKVGFYVQEPPAPVHAFRHTLLTAGMSAYQLTAPMHDMRNHFEAPFFVQDSRHVFFVRPVRSVDAFRPLRGLTDFGIQARSPAAFPLPVILSRPRIASVPCAWPPSPATVYGMDLDDAELDTSADTINKVLASGEIFVFDGVPIGPRGTARSSSTPRTA